MLLDPGEKHDVQILLNPYQYNFFFKRLKIELWKFAQWGHVKDEKTFTVTLASELPILNILLFA